MSLQHRERCGGVYNSGACAHTGKGASWIKLDLGMPQTVFGLWLVGRQDECNDCAKQSSGWVVRVGNTGGASDKLCKAEVDASGGSVVTVTCDTPAAGRYVTLSSPTWMVLCEAQVLGGTELSGNNDDSATNLQACIGECDSDTQCATGLQCFQRSNGEVIPGCKGAGGGAAGESPDPKTWDYCYKPPQMCPTNSWWDRYVWCYLACNVPRCARLPAIRPHRKCRGQC